MLRTTLRWITPHAGRFSPSQVRFMGTHLRPPAFAQIGPFLLLVSLPSRFEKKDRVPSIEELNAAIREEWDRIVGAHQEIGFPDNL